MRKISRLWPCTCLEKRDNQIISPDNQIISPGDKWKLMKKYILHINYLCYLCFRLYSWISTCKYAISSQSKIVYSKFRNILYHKKVLIKIYVRMVRLQWLFIYLQYFINMHYRWFVLRERISRSNLSLKSQPEMWSEMRWEIHFEQNISTIVCLSRIW